MEPVDILALIGILLGVAGVIMALRARHDLKKMQQERWPGLFEDGHKNRDNNSN